MKDLLLHTALLLAMVVVSVMAFHYSRHMSIGYYLLIVMTATFLSLYAFGRLTRKLRPAKARTNRG